MLTLRRINSLLVGLIILVNAYIVLAPLSPGVWFWWHIRHAGTQAQLTQQIHVSRTPPASTGNTLPAGNAVTIPTMLLNQPILEGSNMYAVLARGIWRWPQGSTPDKGSNTILIGHRFTYTNPRGVLYFLNKVGVGDEIGVAWNGRMYVYRVAKTEVVPPSDTSILDPTSRPTLTVYTCTPLWLPRDRLVVIAELEGS